MATVCGALFTPPSAQAASGTWSGGGADGLWSNADNWVGAAIAGGLYTTPATANQDTATFNTDSGQMTVGIDTDRNIKIITFDAAAGSFTLGDEGANGGPTLNLSANGSLGKIQILSTFAGSDTTQTINAPLLLQPTATNGTVTYTFLNDSLTSSNVLNIAGPITSGSTTANGTLTLTGANTGNNTISGAIIGAAAGNFKVDKSGAGAWTIAGALTSKGVGAAGGMAVTGGTINFTDTAVVNLTGKVIVNGGSTMNSSGTVALASAGTSDYVTIGDGSNGILNVTAGTFNISPQTTKAFVISTADSVGGATGEVNVSGGILTLTNNAPIRFGSWDSSTSRHGVGVLTISGTGVFNTGTTSGAVLLGNGSAANSSGTINLDGGIFQTGRSITKGSGSGTINFNGGTLRATATNAAFIASNVSSFVKSEGAVIDTNGFNLTIDSALQGDVTSIGGGLTKKSAGTLTLNGAATYTGQTYIEAGTLALGASGSISDSSEIEIESGATLNVSAAGDFTLGSGKALRGSGSVLGNVILGDGAILAPGSSAGTLDINGSLTFSENSVLSLEITGPAAGDGIGFYDQVNMTAVGGSVSINPAAQLSLSLSGFSPSVLDTFFVLTRADSASFSSFFAGAGEGQTIDLGGGYVGTITYEADSTTSSIVGGNDVAVYGVVPEPASAAMLLTGLGCLLGLRRCGRDASRRQ